MRKFLLTFLAVSSTCLATPHMDLLPESYDKQQPALLELISPTFTLSPIQNPPPSLAVIQKLLEHSPEKPSADVIAKVLKTIECSRLYNVKQNNILTIIDYSLPSNSKRLWIYDLEKEVLLFHTYVAHGINSGTLQTEFFSNRYNSKASSLGVFNTDQAYNGRHGLSLRLDGIERKFNDNAANRSVVIHGGWYVEENFIKRYGRAGRSWGCPAIPTDLTKPIIDTIKNNSLLVVYSPNEGWLANSKFLNCTALAPTGYKSQMEDIKPPEQTRENVLFAGMKKQEPILVMDADHYEHLFQTQPPLERMLRRRINEKEYIALSDQEFARLANMNSMALNTNYLNDLYFVVPEVKESHGYYGTEMRFVDMGKIKELRSQNTNTVQPQYEVILESGRDIKLETSNRFIRWLGL